ACPPRSPPPDLQRRRYIEVRANGIEDEFRESRCTDVTDLDNLPIVGDRQNPHRPWCQSEVDRTGKLLVQCRQCRTGPLRRHQSAALGETATLRRLLVE